MSKFKKFLMEKLQNIVSKDSLTHLPTGFQQIGDKAVLNLKLEVMRYQNEIADLILERFTNINGVFLKKGGVTGEYRTPDLKYIKGSDDPVVVHKEHGISFKFDITKIMFAKGNISERLRLSKVVKEKEVIFDLFSGIGYFSLLIAKNSKPKIIYAFELNPISYNFLVENININKINAEREVIRPIHGDSNQEMLKIGEKADRVIMGIIPAPKNHLKNVFKILNENHAFIHYEGLLNSKDPPQVLLEDVIQEARVAKREVHLLKTNVVKSYKPQINHVTLDIEIK